MSLSAITRTSCRTVMNCCKATRNFSNRNLHESINQLEQRYQNLNARVQILEATPKNEKKCPWKNDKLNPLEWALIGCSAGAVFYAFIGSKS